MLRIERPRFISLLAGAALAGIEMQGRKSRPMRAAGPGVPGPARRSWRGRAPFPARATYRICALAAGALLAAAAAAAPAVRTTGGMVSGAMGSGVEAFLGIPYARPPVGDLRWRAPQPAASWRGVRAATHFAPSCMQGEPKPFGPYTAPFLITPERSEDCLYLNVWAPARHAGKRPVYVFIHGGAFQSGGADVPVYNGASLARNGAVVVTINYRLGIFGFFAHPDLTRESPLGSSGNYGLLDVIASLRWVHANIAGFGGDPGNITIAGQSAGAAAVNYLMVSPPAKGLFQRAVIESGPVLGLPMSSLVQRERAGIVTAAALKGANIAALRALPAAELAKAPPTSLPWPNVDGKVIVSDPERADAQIVSRVPVIAGYNRDERKVDAPRTVAAFEKDVRQALGAFAERALGLYPHGSDAEAARSGAEFARDRYVAALLFWAEARSRRGQPVYGYLFERVFPGSDPELYGAFHTAEVPYILGAFDLKGVRFSEEDRRISSQMQGRWLAFMARGSPSPAGAPGTWPRISGNSHFIWRIDPAGPGPAITPERLGLFRQFAEHGGKLGLF